MMKNISNLKVNFSKILEEKYSMTQEGINGYWANKAKEEMFEIGKKIGASIGMAGMYGTSAFGLVDHFYYAEHAVPFYIAAGVTTLITGVSLLLKNPYKLKKYKEIDKEYEEMKLKTKLKKHM